MDELNQFTANLEQCVRSCLAGIQDGAILDEVMIVRLDSAYEALVVIETTQTVPWARQVKQLLEMAINLLLTMVERPNYLHQRGGRPKVNVSTSLVEYLLSLTFRPTDIAKIVGVSRRTIFGRMHAAGLSVSQTYTNITDDGLNEQILSILTRFPSTGYKRMKGFLLEQGVRVTEHRVRLAMRDVDPEGVYFRTIQNRCIVRRQYFVTYFNQLWHLDTNMKLIRWNIVIRSCIDGKSRFVTYLDAGTDNTAESNLVSFMKAVASYGIPYRTRSDKGGENVLIARFMIEQRGENRGSHICGRSVHNQRIERYWRDVLTSGFYNVLSALEEDGYLNIDNPNHICLVHHIFVPRLNQSLETFRNAWNLHPLSSERNYSPTQLMVMSLPPPQYDLQLGEEELQHAYFLCNRLVDVSQLLVGEEDSIIAPAVVGSLDERNRNRLSGVDVLRDSTDLGYDIFLECLNLIS